MSLSEAGAPAATPPAEGPSALLAAFVSGLSLTTVPPAVLAAARRAVARTAATAAAAVSQAPAKELLAVLVDQLEGGEATVFGTSSRLPAPYAAFVNATAARSADPAGGGAFAVAAAALSTGERVRAAVDDLLAGVVAGLEVKARLEAALSRDGRGWDLAGTAGHVAAAAAAARTARADPQVVLSAIGFSATQAAGLSASAGTAAFSLSAGKSAADAVESFLLCAAGLVGPPLPLEGRRGLFALVGSLSAVTSLAVGLGADWALEIGSADGTGDLEGASPLDGTVCGLCEELNRRLDGDEDRSKAPGR